MSAAACLFQQKSPLPENHTQLEKPATSTVVRGRRTAWKTTHKNHTVHLGMLNLPHLHPRERKRRKNQQGRKEGDLPLTVFLLQRRRRKRRVQRKGKETGYLQRRKDTVHPAPREKGRREGNTKSTLVARPQKSRRHRYRSSSNSTNSQSESCGSRHRLRSQLQDKGGKGRLGRSRHASKRTSHSEEAGELAGSPFLGCTLQNNYFLSTAELISNSGSATGLFKKATGQLGNQSKETRDVHEYDSGNATSSPPSVQTSTSRSKGSQETKGEACNGFGQAFSSGKASSVSSPDSGNSLHSYRSQSKGPTLEEPSPSPGHLCKDQNGGSWPSLEPLGKKKANIISPPFSSSPLQPCLRNESPSSRSSLDSESLHHKLGRRSSPSPSCCSSKSR
ncbi:serine/arginine repetitive matrix protein 4-like [Crotalus adamanteus]|uniref:Serine/arginine repetitive matrix protein 4-like n=1 Tax=Crotalus adamanteus TaxID=8729 RepID=A0AAW1APF6_CROAD